MRRMEIQIGMIWMLHIVPSSNLYNMDNSYRLTKLSEREVVFVQKESGSGYFRKRKPHRNTHPENQNLTGIRSRSRSSLNGRPPATVRSSSENGER
ncbi:hypothetical protein P8452_25849 [Trifolium repens]|nr:hypothetical protein P8452_25849 [Trifolium repens]